ncbi:MAG TPA: carboxypeptidase-like regulatory domain-containing protein [Longimicrobiales bacterium]|nr:carboxypeptidase-like regulatory domain-containing protein [Longimicrobiales bacterium]
MSRGVAGAALLAAAALGCAQASSPPGGEPDRVPPRVVSVSPLPFDTLEDLRSAVVIEFDERLSERLEGVRGFEDAVLVSPATGEITVKRGRRSLEVSMAGGWRPGLVYRVVVLPLFSDLFGNQRVEPVELVFSTGAPIPPTAVAGLIEDRLTGDAVAGARVAATRREDAVVYVAVSDTGGFFSLRNIPAGVYDVQAWLDQDRDREPDFLEPQDAEAFPLEAQDTVVLTMALLPGDTTPARLLRAEVVDSMRVRLHFDDYFEPGPVAGRASVWLLPDTTFVTAGSLIHSTALHSLLAVERAAADSVRMAAELAADTLAPRGAAVDDSIAAPDTTRVRRLPVLPPADPAAPGQRGGVPATPRGQGARSQRPSRELVVVLPVPLAPEATYLVEVSDVLNIHDLPGGGGRVTFATPARADPPDS